MSIIEASLMDLTAVCQGFPELNHQVHRDNLLDVIDTMFEGDTRVAVVEGTDGIGKTTLLAQFAKRHPHNALSLFVTYTSQWAYDPKALKVNLYNQILWVLYKEEMPASEDVEDGWLLNSYLDLNKKGQRNKELYYFVLDGLDEFPKKEDVARQLILNILPIGFSNFRFLLTGDISQLSKQLPPKVPSKPFPLPTFTLDDTIRYFGELLADRSAIEEVYKLCAKLPGHLSSVRRILESGSTVEELLQGDPRKSPNFFDVEWRKVNTSDTDQLNILAILAHDRKRHFIKHIARVIKSSSERVGEAIKPLNFIDVNAETNEIGFVSEAFRKFAANKLLHLKGNINQLLINDLLETPDSNEALTYLPAYYEQSGDYDKVLDYLSGEHFVKMLESSQSLNPIQLQAELGVNTSRRHGRDWDLIRFSIQKSALTEFADSEAWRPELEARVALGNYQSALAIAQSIVLKEDRLHALAVVARKKRELGEPTDQDLLNQLRLIYNDLDPKTLASRATEIAADLIYSLPDLAIDLVEKAAEVNPSENSLDWSLATLSISALQVNLDQSLKTDAENPDASERIQSKIKDPRARRYSATASLLFKEYSAKQVISEVEKLESTGDRIFLLRKWAGTNREKDDAAEVIDYALKEAIRSTPYTFNATVLRELAVPLPYIADKLKAKQLVSVFDSQLGAVEHLGPTEDFVRLQLLLARAEVRYDQEAAHNRVTDMYLKVSYLGEDELDLKTACLAWMVASLADMDPKQELEAEKFGKLHSSTEAELVSNIDKLLSGTADHYSVTKPVINALARLKPQMALKLVMALNLETRRDAALFDLFNLAIQIPVENIEFDLLNNALGNFVSVEIRDIAVLAMIERLSADPDKFSSINSKAKPFLGKAETIRDAGDRARACCLAYTLLLRSDLEKHASYADHLLNNMDAAWEAIDRGWSKVEAGFRIAEILAAYSHDKAQEFISRTEELRDEVLMDVGSTVHSYIGCLHLAIRAFSGLMPKTIDTADDIERLARLIDMVPSNGERAALWAQIAVRYFLNKRTEMCKKIVNERVKPRLEAIPKTDGAYRVGVIVTIAPTLYVSHAQTTLELIKELSIEERDEAYRRIARLILRKQPPDDPYDSSGNQLYDVEHEDIVDILNLMNLMDGDSSIYEFIKPISQTLTANQNRTKYTYSQKSYVATRLRNLVTTKFPNPRNIKHDGYKIAAEAYIARIEGVGLSQWKKLVDDANQISNAADSALVLCLIASALPSKEAAARTEIFTQAKQLVERIPAQHDRVERYETLTELSAATDKALARSCVRAALETTLKTNDPEAHPSQRKLVDLAYRIDGNFAASMAALADNDPAKSSAKSVMCRQLDVLKLKEQMANETGAELQLSRTDKRNSAEAAWRNLAALNSNRISHVRLENARDWVHAAASLPLGSSYPILAWVIENAIRRLAHTGQAQMQLRNIYEATLLGTELSGAMAARSSQVFKRASAYASTSRGNTNLVARPDSREDVLEFIQNWFANEVHDYLKICDQYFSLQDLHILQLLRAAQPDCRVQILTSRKQNKDILTTIEESYNDHWKSISDQHPPDTDVIVIGIDGNGDAPIHDRWWLTNGGGLRVGTSLNSLGLVKISEISKFSQEEAEVLERDVDQYLFRVKREHQGKKLLYKTFTLDG